MQISTKPLVTVAILAYNNLNFIQDCLDSVLEQDYENIQLIVSDDGTKSFDSETLEYYINCHKNENIKSVFVHTMPQNSGTSINFNYVLSLAEGKYIKYIAADDLFYDVHSLSDLVMAAESENSNVVIARAPNYDMYLERQQWIYPSDEHWAMMKDAARDPKMFFGIMSQFCLISAPATLMNRQLLQKYGGADEKYRLIEDWPLWMKLLRDNEMFTFLDKSVVIYRSGGVSNGEKHAAYAEHQIEYANVIRDECLCYPDAMANKHQYQLAKSSEHTHRFEGERMLIKEKNILNKIVFFFRYLDIYSAKLTEKIRALFWKYQNSKRDFFMSGIIILTLFSITDIAALFNAGKETFVVIVVRNIGILVGSFYLAVSLCLYTILIFWRIRNAIFTRK